ncbi:2-(1,2-epoxy-1,2-dihydrophenyl)acetyl-CoA isomerase PaaG [Ferrovibrio sp.]|uniref:2-(1,2-epoxy-1,2-dihydrophenyl)acetyl-CoA isomerase PaaG n=1 Tax=Ferrovibrio sp. TaxID=1917215 RepID=UPI00311D52C7
MNRNHASDDAIVSNTDGGILRLTLNRPDKLNSFNSVMHLMLQDALHAAAKAEDVRVVIITGAGRAFCAGQDLSDNVYTPGAPPADLGKTIESYWNPLVRQIRRLPKPVIAAVNGTAAGAGANLALACDIVIAARSAKFIQSFAKIGLVPDSGGTWLLPRLIGDARARAISLTGDPVTAEQAADWGMIWKTVDDGALAETVENLAQSFASGPTYGYGLQKKAFLSSASSDFDAQLSLERDLQRDAGFSADYAEGVAAFMERRQPQFRGK